MDALSSINALAIDPDMDSRLRVKQATQPMHQFKKVQLTAKPIEAQNILELSDPIDVFFISERLKEEDVTGFIKKAKEMKAGQDAAFVLLASAASDEGGR